MSRHREIAQRLLERVRNMDEAQLKRFVERIESLEDEEDEDEDDDEDDEEDEENEDD